MRDRDRSRTGAPAPARCGSPATGPSSRTGSRSWCSSGARAPSSSTPRASGTLTAVDPVLLSDRLLVRRGDGRGRVGAALDAVVRHDSATAHPPAIKLATALAERAPGDLDRVFFTNGGWEWVEAAWKIVRQHYLAKGEPQRSRRSPGDRLPRGDTRGPALQRHTADEGADRRRADPGHADRRREPLRDPEAPGRRRAVRALLAEVERTMIEAGPETVAMLIAEPVQNAGGCLRPAGRLLARAARAVRQVRDRAGRRRGDHRLRADRRVVRVVGLRRRAGPDPVREGHHVRLRADGRHAGLGPDHGAVVRGRADADARITFAEQPVAAAIAQRNVAIFERKDVLKNVRALEPVIDELLEDIKSRVPIIGDVRGAGFFWALELMHDAAETRFSAEGARSSCTASSSAACSGGPDRPARRSPRRRAAPRATAGHHPRRARGDARPRRRRCWPTPAARFSRGGPYRARLLARGGRRRAAGPPARGDVIRRRRRHRRRLHGLSTAWQLRARAPRW